MNKKTIFILTWLQAAFVFAQPQVTVLSESAINVRYDASKKSGKSEWKTSKVNISFDNDAKELVFKDKEGNVILRTLSNQGRDDREIFYSPDDEFIYGTGQFQDGYLNVRGLTRRLTQVNTQISIPFILSNKGYGIMWNNPGMTEFNPADNMIVLKEQDGDVVSETVDATSTLGNKRERRDYIAFAETIDVADDGDYSLLLDVGQKMARKHYLAVDGKVITDFNNIWLPPTSSVIMNLSKGKHKVEVRGVRGDSPKIYWRKVDNTTTFSSPETKIVDYTVFLGNADDIIKEYRRISGEVPMIPKWALGYIHCRERYHSQDEILQTAKEFRRRQIPISMIVQDWQWWGKYGWNAMKFDEDHYPNPKQLTDSLHAMGIKLMLSVWSKVDKNSDVGKELKSKNYYIDNTDWVDFFNKDAAACYWKHFSKGLARPHGIDAWWQDATEPENDDLEGRRPDVRNIYPLMVNKTVYEGLMKDFPNRRQFILTRSAFSGIQKYGVATWSGDVGNDWETLRRQIAGGLGQMATGLPWWTYDAGGFFRPGNQYTNDEYQARMLRWIQTSVFLPLMRVHGYMSDTEPWKYSKQTERLFVDAIKTRYKLMPYIYSVAAKVSREGYTMMRPLVFDFPNDTEALKQTTEYMFGPALLINPILEANPTTWTTYLPETKGGWFDFWTNTHYDGGQSVTIPVSNDHIPVFVRAGSIVPMTDGIITYPGADGEFYLYDDDGETNDYLKGKYEVKRLVLKNGKLKIRKAK